MTSSSQRIHKRPARIWACLAAILLVAGCAPSEQDAAEVSPIDAILSSEADVTYFSLIMESRKEDLDEMLARRTIRALVVPSKTFYFFDGAEQRGFAYEMLKAFEDFLNKRRERTALKVNLVFIPVSRAKLLPALREGYGDLAVANLTITPARQSIFDFSDPVYRNVQEVLALGPDSPPIDALADLSGKTLHTRAESSYYESLQSLNQRFVSEGRAPVRVELVPDHDSDEDLFEMVSMGTIPGIVIDSHRARFWAHIFRNVDVRYDIVLREDGNTAWAMNKGTPGLKAAVNEFLQEQGPGTLEGNLRLRKYFEQHRHADKPFASGARQKFRDTAPLFRKYAEMYALDWRMIISQAFQESRLDQSALSHRGAVGIMQVLPETAADKNVNVGDITVLENNIHAGNKYLRYIRDTWFESEPMDDFNKTLFSFAAYNAGPTRIARLRRQAEAMGFDPNLWFDNVEVVASRRIGRETVDYVSNIYKYWVAFTLNDGNPEHSVREDMATI